MELFSERLRHEALAEAEARGESFWTDEIPQTAGIKLAFAWEDLPTEMPYGGSATVWETVQRIAQRSMGTTQRLSPSEAWARGAAVPTAMTYLEAAVVVLGAYCDTGECPDLTQRHMDDFIDRVNTIFLSHRVSYKLVQEQIVPLKSEELHAEVVEPVLYLLHGRPDLEAAQIAFRNALREISDDKADDAVTDAGTALQETLEALGCDGHSLGQLITSAKRKGLLGSHDERLTDSIELALKWAAIERNEGEAHHAVHAELSDAWLMVHVVGALIVRLADDSLRGTPQP